jgi:glyoxylase-like metal-dependent hydrolase (beta-lactamase superfamily II)
VLELKFVFNGIENTIYPVMLCDEKEVILVDCGYPGFLNLIKDIAESKDVDMNRLTKIIITHHDYDHMGSLAAFKREYPNIKILSSIDDEAYVSGKIKSLRLQQAEKLYDLLPENEKEGAEAFQQLLESIEPSNVDIGLHDGDSFPWCGGVEIITTPGHMPGHISIYLKDFKTLISGDALVIENGELAIANPRYTLDIIEAKKSIKKLLSREIDKIICYHGGVYAQDNIKDSLQKLSST